MKETHKKVFGFLGLAAVAAMTATAAVMPGPGVAATSSTVTDSIVVTVVALTPDVNIIKPVNGAILTGANQTMEFNYANVGQVTATLKYTDINGTTNTYTLYSNNANLQPGSQAINLNLLGASYGYGEYVLNVSGRGQAGVDDADVSAFSFVPVSATVEEDAATGKIEAVLDYDENSTDLDHFTINVYDKNGNLVTELSPIDVQKPTKRVELPFAEKNIPEGEYTVSVSAYDVNGVEIYKAFDTVYTYKPIKVPNTGGLFGILNITKTDYLITGLFVFLLIGVGGIFYIAKGKSTRR